VIRDRLGESAHLANTAPSVMETSIAQTANVNDLQMRPTNVEGTQSAVETSGVLDRHDVASLVSPKEWRAIRMPIARVF
jgi:hypothetical protein